MCLHIPNTQEESKCQIKNVEVKSQVPAAGKMLAALMDPAPQPLRRQLLPPLLASTSVQSLEIQAGTLRHFSTILFMEGPTSCESE